MSGAIWVKTIEPNKEERRYYFGFDAGFEGMVEGPGTLTVSLGTPENGGEVLFSDTVSPSRRGSRHLLVVLPAGKGSVRVKGLEQGARVFVWAGQLAPRWRLQRGHEFRVPFFQGADPLPVLE